MSLSGSLATGMIFRLMAPTYQGTLKIKTNVFELDAQVSAGEPSYGAYVLTIAAFYLLYVVVFRYLNYRDQRP